MNKNKKTLPFFHRNYGGFTSSQKAFFEEILNPLENKKILDPMAGQGFYLSEYCFFNNSIELGDLNPAPILLASLRNPEFIKNKDIIFDVLQNELLKISIVDQREEWEHRYVDNWLADPIIDDLQKYMHHFNMSAHKNSLANREFWDFDVITKFTFLLPILAARYFVNFHSSDNKTWLKPGGLLHYTSLKMPLFNALKDWKLYANEKYEMYHDNFVKGDIGKYHCSIIDTEQEFQDLVPTMDAIITSPPYANRLDYTRLWRPELLIASYLFNLDINYIKSQQVGSTVVKTFDHENFDYESLPPIIRDSLEKILKENNEHKDSLYYYKFFSRYALSLQKSLINMSKCVRKGGIIIIFIRDTVRKDILFPTSQLISETLLQQKYRILKEPEQKIIRSHIGLLRKNNTKPGLQGLAQREWWLSYQKD